MIQCGEIYFAELDDAGSHPVIVVSREDLNRGRYAMVVVCTSAGFAKRSTVPNCVPFRAGQFGFTSDCVAQWENIVTMDVSLFDMATGPIGQLDESAHREVIRAIGHVIKSDCEPI